MILPLPRTGPVEPLQVAVDDERQVVQTLESRDVNQPSGLRLIHLAVTEERPDVLVRRVGEASGGQVTVEPGLHDRVHGAEPHRDRGELPEVRHQPRVRVARQPVARATVRELLAEAVEPIFGQSPLEVGPGVDPGRRVPLDEHLVAAARVVLAAEEVVEPDLVERRRRRVGRDVPADADARALRAVHRDRGIPADPAAVRALGLLVAGEPGLAVRGDGVDVVGAGHRRNADVLLAGALQHPQHEIARALAAAGVQDGVERLQPLGGLVRVGVGEVCGKPLPDHGEPVVALVRSRVPSVLRCPVTGLPASFVGMPPPIVPREA